HRLEVAESREAALNRRKVRQQASEPALVHEEHPAALRLLGNRVLRLPLRPDEEDRAPIGRQIVDELLRVAEQFCRLGQVDDVDAVPLTEDVFLHLRVPALGLVAEVDAGLQQILQRDTTQAPSHYRLLNWKRLRAPFCPYFLRSLIRASRVRKPSFLSRGRSSRLYSTSARAMPRRSAPAWPAMPPPAIVASTSNLSDVSVTSSGCLIWVRSASVGEACSIGLWLVVRVPEPGLR